MSHSSMWKIPLFELDITDDDIEAVCDPLRRRWVTMGEVTREFEASFARSIDVRHALAVSSGTAALHMALMALDIQPDDEVLLPSFTFVACANVVRALHAKPVFVDIESESDWTISVEDIERKITPKSRAILVVHYAGFSCRMEPIQRIAEIHHLSIVEDCAHALITRHHSRYCGTIGDIGCFSFFSNKNMTTSEGGMVVTNNGGLAERLRLLRSHGMTTLTLDRYQGRAVSYDVPTIGLNYRIDELRSALGASQLKRLQANLDKRKTIYDLYLNELALVDEIMIPFLDRPREKTGYHIFPIALSPSIDRNRFIQRLKEQGIQTSIHYPPIHRFQAYQAYSNGQSCHCPLTEEIASREVTLPFYPSMTEADVRTVCDSIQSTIHRRV